MDMRYNFLATSQLYGALSDIKKISDVLLLHKEYHKPLVVPDVEEMPVSVSNTTLKEEVAFVKNILVI